MMNLWIFCVFLFALTVCGKGESAAPTFLSSPSNINASVGDLARLLCRVSGPPKTEYWWEKNNNRLRKSKKYRVKKFRYLRIKNVDKSDAGEYVCWASYGGSRIHQTITLNVKDPHSGNLTGNIAPYFTEKGKMKKDYLLFPVGNKLKIVCSANGRPKPSVRWYKDNKKLKYMPDGVTPLTNTSFEVIFESLKPRHAGEYKCQVSNKAGAIEKSYTVKVKEMMVVKPILQSIKNITAYEGDNVTITCKAVSDGLPHFQWVVKENNTFKVLDQRLRADENVWKSNSDRWHGVNLRLVNVTQKDERGYYCMVGDDRGYDYQKFQLNVIPRPVTPEESAAPTFSSSPTNIIATVGDQARLLCHVNGPPKTEYWWEKNNNRLRQSKKYRSKKFRYLRIKIVDKTDAGDYVCWASYRGSKVHRTITLNVKDPHSDSLTGDIAPYFTEKGKMKKDYLLFPAGNKLKIVCSANGRPKPSVRWYKDNKKLTYMPDDVTPLTNTSFEIIYESLKPKHAGEYKCQVSNKVGDIEKTYTVKVKGKTTHSINIQAHGRGEAAKNSTKAIIIAMGLGIVLVLWY